MAAKLSLLILILTVSSAAAAIASSPIEFIRMSCASTLYPALCFQSLSPYAPTVNGDPLKLSQVATLLSLSRLRSVSSRISHLSFSSSSSSPFMSTNSFAAASPDHATVSNALRDCAHMLGSASDRTKDSMAELKKLKGMSTKAAAAGPNETPRAWCVSNVQTWMSAALTNEETCTDGLKEAGAKMSVMADVGSRVGVAKQFTSIALALVNKLATTP